MVLAMINPHLSGNKAAASRPQDQASDFHLSLDE